MSLHDYRVSQRLATDDYSFAALIMAAMRRADSGNAQVLKRAFPEIWDELVSRYLAPGGVLEQPVATHTCRGADCPNWNDEGCTCQQLSLVIERA